MVATGRPCAGCAQPGPTGIAILRGNPVVVFGDAAKDSVETATLQGSKWVVNVVQTHAQGLGLSVSTTGTTAYASYYTGHGAVRVALLDDHAPTTMEVAKVPNPSPSKTGNSASRTAVAATKDGTIYVAWDDQTKGLQFASGTDTFTPIDIVDSVTVVAGTYGPVVHISGTTNLSGELETDEVYTAPGVGVVLQLITVGGKTTRRELIERFTGGMSVKRP